jgi:hypothetical protein
MVSDDTERRKNMKMLDEFYDYTTQGNEGFKIRFGNILVSVCCHNQLDAMSKMESEQNGIVGKNIDYSKMASGMMALTFISNNTEVAIIDLYTEEYVTDTFTTFADDYSNIAYGITPFELVNILVKVKDYQK